MGKGLNSNAWTSGPGVRVQCAVCGTGPSGIAWWRKPRRPSWLGIRWASRAKRRLDEQESEGWPGLVVWRPANMLREALGRDQALKRIERSFGSSSLLFVTSLVFSSAWIPISPPHPSSEGGSRSKRGRGRGGAPVPRAAIAYHSAAASETASRTGSVSAMICSCCDSRLIVARWSSGSIR